MVWPWNDLDLEGQMSRSHKVQTTNKPKLLKGLKNREKSIFDLFDLEMTLTSTFKVRCQGHLVWPKVQTNNSCNMLKGIEIA